MGNLVLIKTKHPQINEMLEMFEQENGSAFRKVHRMIDLFEVIIKTHTAAIMASYFELNDMSDEMKSLLAWGLRTPSLGHWCLFAREAVKDMVIRKSLSTDEYLWALNKLNRKSQVSIIESCYQQEGSDYQINYKAVSKIPNAQKRLVETFQYLDSFKLCPSIIAQGFLEYYLQWDSYLKAGEKYPKKDVVAFRNVYAHGGTPSEEECLADIQAYMPLLSRMLNEKWLHKTSVEVGTQDGNQPGGVYLVREDKHKLDLFPLLHFISDSEQNLEHNFYFLNDLKNFEQNKGEICLLNYPDAKLRKNYDCYESFLKVINIVEWKEYKLKDEFQQRINELSESFKGRMEEKETVFDFINKKSEGFLLLSGSPGVGKSALMAKSIAELRADKEKELHVIEYFIRRNTQGRPEKKYLEYMHRKLDEIYNTNIKYTEDVETDLKNLYQKLEILSNVIDKKLIIFIDGLDEGVTKDNHNILSYLLTRNYRNILIIYSSRLTADVESFFFKLPVEHRRLELLKGLKTEDIKGMLYEVANKYEVNKRAQYVEEVLKKSEGNPLYVKLLCLDIEKGNRSIDCIDQIPENLLSLYDEIIARFAEASEGDTILSALYIIAAAREYVSPMFIGLCLGKDESQLHRALRSMREILVEDNANKSHYQLFHESFREYLTSVKKEEVDRAHDYISKFCCKWKEHLSKQYLSENIRGYAAKYYSYHLEKLEMYQEMQELVLGDSSEGYIQYQVELTDQFELSFQLYKDACKLFAGMGKIDALIQTSVKALELHQKKNKLYTDIFRWMYDGKLDTLNKASHRILIYEGEEKKSLFMLLLHHTFNSKHITREQKREFVKACFDKSELYLDLVKSDVPLPSFVIGSVIEGCINYKLDFSKLIDAEYRYCKADYERYEHFYSYIHSINEYLLDKGCSIKLCINVIEAMTDISIASKCGVKLLKLVYDRTGQWDEQLLGKMLDLAEKSYIGCGFGYPFYEVIQALLETSRLESIEQLINEYLAGDKMSSCSDQRIMMENIGDLVIALYENDLLDKGDRIFNEVLYPAMVEYRKSSKSKGIMDKFIIKLHTLGFLDKGSELLHEFIHISQYEWVFNPIIYSNVKENNVRYDRIAQIADYYKNDEDVLNIISSLIQKNSKIELEILLKEILVNSALYIHFERIHKNLEPSDRRKVRTKSTEYFVEEILTSYDASKQEQEDVEIALEKARKRGRRTELRIYKGLFERLIDRKRFVDGILLYLECDGYIGGPRLDYIDKYIGETIDADLLADLHRGADKYSGTDTGQWLVNYIIDLYIETDDFASAFKWYDRLEKGRHPVQTIIMSDCLYSNKDIWRAESILEDLFHRVTDKLVIPKKRVEYFRQELEKFRSDSGESVAEELAEKDNGNAAFVEEATMLEDEKKTEYMCRLAKHKYYTSLKEEFLTWAEGIKEQVYIQDITIGLARDLIRKDDIELLIRLDNMIIDDMSYKEIPITILIDEMSEQGDVDKIKRWIDIAEVNIDTYYMKKSFYEELLSYAAEFRDKFPQVAGTVIPYVLNDQKLLGDYLLNYITYILSVGGSELKNSKLHDSLKSVFVLDEVLENEKKSYAYDQVKDWIHSISSEEDREEILELIEDYKKGQITEERMNKKLERILREYK